MLARLVLLLALVPATALAAPVSLRAADGVTVRAEASGHAAQGMVLVHDDGGTLADFDAVCEQLAGRGLAVVAVGLRGGPGPRDEATWAKAPDDVAAAIAWLRKEGAQHVVLVGVGAGGAVALHAAAVDATVEGVVMIGPKLGTPGLKIGDDLTAYGKRPLMLVASAADAASSRAAEALRAKAAGVATVKLVASTATGVRLIADDPHLESELVAFATASLREEAKAQSSLAQGELDELETTGTKYKP